MTREERDMIVEKFAPIPPKNHMKKWDEDDEYILEQLILRGVSLDNIAKALERKPNAIFSRVAHKAYQDLIELSRI